VKRIAISLDEHAHAELARHAHAAAEPVARTAARLVRDGLLSTNGARPATPPQRTRELDAGARAPWLEPGPDARERWRRETWAAVCALHDRYSRQLKKLPADWWTDRSLVETLGALSAWRTQLDRGASDDPRAELLFHDRLEMLQRRLESNRGLSHFTAGPPPPEWLQ
jgi:hypothetical protein